MSKVKTKPSRPRAEHHMASIQMNKASVVPSGKVYKRKPKYKPEYWGD